MSEYLNTGDVIAYAGDDTPTSTPMRTTRGLTVVERALLPMQSAMLGYLAATPRERRTLLREARKVQRAHRVGYGYKDAAVRIFTPAESQSKLRKSKVYTLGLSLLPHTQSGFGNLCPAATACAKVCLVSTGKGALAGVRKGRLVRTAFVLTHPDAAGVIMAHEMLTAIAAHGEIRVRLNVLSDLRWERVIPDAMLMFHVAGVRFYDYTKWAPRHRDSLGGIYSLTYSAHERMNDDQIETLVRQGYNVAVVLRASKYTVKGMTHWRGLPLVDGISTDDRTTDPRGVVVGLAALGSAIRDTSGFVRSI